MYAYHGNTNYTMPRITAKIPRKVILISVMTGTRKVDVRLPGKGSSNSHGARPVHLIITMIKRIRTSGLSITNSLYDWQTQIATMFSHGEDDSEYGSDEGITLNPKP